MHYSFRKWSIIIGLFLSGVICGTFLYALSTNAQVKQLTTYVEISLQSINELKMYNPGNRMLTIDTLNGKQIMRYFMWSNQSSCSLVHDFGGVMLKNPSGLSGQKSVCLDPKVSPQSENCLVYSFGISSEWSFEEAMEKYGCDVYCFDPSMGKKQHDHSPQIHFFPWALSSSKNNRKRGPNRLRYHSLSSIYNLLSTYHGNRTIDYLNIDKDFGGWEVISDVMNSSNLLNRIRQFAVKIHLLKEEPIDTYRILAHILRSLEVKGMVRFDSKYDPWHFGNFTKLDVWAPLNYDLVWYNSNLLRSSTSF